MQETKTSTRNNLLLSNVLKEFHQSPGDQESHPGHQEFHPGDHHHHPQKKFAKVMFYTRLSFCQQAGVVVSQHALQVVSQHALQQVFRGGEYPSMPCKFPGPHPGGKLKGIWPVGGGYPGLHPRGQLRAIWQGDLQAHTWGVSRPTPGGLSQHALRQTPDPSFHVPMRIKNSNL